MKSCWANYLLWAVIAVFGTGALLSACGRKGDLYLPDHAHKQEQKKDQSRK